jgi:hypothetical protein
LLGGRSGSGATRGANIKAVTYAIVYSISGEAIRQLAQQHPSLQLAIQRVAEARASELSQVGGQKNLGESWTFDPQSTEEPAGATRSDGSDGSGGNAQDVQMQMHGMHETLAQLQAQTAELHQQSAVAQRQAAEGQRQAAEGLERMTGIEEQVRQMSGMLAKLMAGTELHRVEIREVKEAVTDLSETIEAIPTATS